MQASVDSALLEKSQEEKEAKKLSTDFDSVRLQI